MAGIVCEWFLIGKYIHLIWSSSKIATSTKSRTFLNWPNLSYFKPEPALILTKNMNRSWSSVKTIMKCTIVIFRWMFVQVNYSGSGEPLVLLPFLLLIQTYPRFKWASSSSSFSSSNTNLSQALKWASSSSPFSSSNTNLFQAQVSL